MCIFTVELISLWDILPYYTFRVSLWHFWRVNFGSGLGSKLMTCFSFNGGIFLKCILIELYYIAVVALAVNFGNAGRCLCIWFVGWVEETYFNFNGSSLFVIPYPIGDTEWWNFVCYLICGRHLLAVICLQWCGICCFSITCMYFRKISDIQCIKAWYPVRQQSGEVRYCFYQHPSHVFVCIVRELVAQLRQRSRDTTRRF